MDNVTGRILLCAKEKNIKDAEICRALGAKKDKVYTWKTGRSTPTTDEVRVLADFLNVSVAYLLGETNLPAPPEEDVSLDELSYALYGEVKEMTEEQKEELLNFARYLLAKDKKKGE